MRRRAWPLSTKVSISFSLATIASRFWVKSFSSFSFSGRVACRDWSLNLSSSALNHALSWSSWVSKSCHCFRALFCFPITLSGGLKKKVFKKGLILKTMLKKVHGISDKKIWFRNIRDWTNIEYFLVLHRQNFKSEDMN